jgi:hypothetical protein
MMKTLLKKKNPKIKKFNVKDAIRINNNIKRKNLK